MAIQQKFRISFVVDKELVPTVTALVVDRVSSLHIEEVESVKHGNVRVKKANGKSMAWARPAFKAVAELMIQKGPDKDHHFTAMAKALPSVGVGEGSISPVASGMVDAGLVTRTARGLYKLTEKGKVLPK